MNLNEQLLQAFIQVIQSAKIYSLNHPQFAAVINQLWNSLTTYFSQKDKFILGLVDQELCLENQIFFDLSAKASSFVQFLKERGIEKIEFSAGLTLKELETFVTFLLHPQSKTEKDLNHQLKLLGVEHIQVGKLKASFTSSLSPMEKKAKFDSRYEAALHLATSGFEKIMIKQELKMVDLQFTALTLLESFSGNYLDLISPSRPNQETPSSTPHVINVAVLSMYIGSQLGWPKKVLIDLGVGALFHDLALLVEKKLLSKHKNFSVLPPDLLPAYYGASLLIPYLSELGPLPLVIAFESHLPYNLQAYPDRPPLRPPHPASQIVAISDAYDSLIHDQLVHNKFAPSKAISKLLHEKGKKYDPFILEKFVEIIGYWPLDCRIKLSNGWIAQVIKINPQFPAKPVVEIIHPPGPTRYLDLSQEKKLSIKQALYPAQSDFPQKH